MSDWLKKTWLVYLIILPLNVTFFVGVERVMPVDFILAVLLVLALPTLFRRFGEIAGSDYPVMIYLVVLSILVIVSSLREGFSRTLLYATAGQAVGLATYLVFRATVRESRELLNLVVIWVRVSFAVAFTGVLFLLFANFGWETKLVEWCPNLGPGLWRLIGTIGHTPNFAYSYFHISFFLSVGLLLTIRMSGDDIVIPRISERVAWIAVFMNSLAILLTFSRGVVGGLFGLIIIAQAILERSGRKKRIYSLSLWTSFFCLFLYVTIFFTYTTDAFVASSQAEVESLRLDKQSPRHQFFFYKNVQQLPDKSAYIHLPGGLAFLPGHHWYLLKGGWTLFLDNPLFGQGPGRFPEKLVALRDSRAGVVPSTLSRQKPHSTLMGALAEGGIIGLSGLLVLWMFFLSGGMPKALKKDPLGLSIYAAIAGYVIFGFNVDIMNFRWLWLLFAVAATRASVTGYDSARWLCKFEWK